MLFETLQGTLTYLSIEYAVLETGGVGYKIFIPANLFTKSLTLGQTHLLYISHVIREDSQKFYGFSTRTQRDFFEKLCTISGVGAKTALSMIGHMENSQLKSAIEMGNATLLAQIPGIGKKTAERIIVDLSDTMHKWRLENPEQQHSCACSNAALDALQTLLNLGYNRAQAQKAIATVLEKTPGNTPSLEKIITDTLKLIHTQANSKIS